MVPAMADSWRATGKDSTGAETWTLGALIISNHPASGVNLFRKEGAVRVLVSIGFINVEVAKRYCERNGVAA